MMYAAPKRYERRRRVRLAAVALARQIAHGLSARITRRMPLAEWQHVLDRRLDDVKVIVGIRGTL